MIEHHARAIVQQILSHFQRVNGNAALWADVLAPSRFA
jgi:hypothetical protein